MQFEQLPPDLQDTVLGVTEMLNNKIHPPDWTGQIVPILKPFDINKVPDDAIAEEMPKWFAHYRLEDGKWIFKFLSE